MISTQVGAIVLLWDAKIVEWYYAALQAGITHLSVNASTAARVIDDLDPTTIERLVQGAKRVQDELVCPFVAACDWPAVPRGDGVCLECSPEDVPNCLDAAQSLNGAACECVRCATPWLGPACDVSLAAAPTTAPTWTTPVPTARTALSDGSTGVAPARAATFVVVVLVMNVF